jgi:hypothetical protein
MTGVLSSDFDLLEAKSLVVEQINPIYAGNLLVALTRFSPSDADDCVGFAKCPGDLEDERDIKAGQMRISACSR